VQAPKAARRGHSTLFYCQFHDARTMSITMPICSNASLLTRHVWTNWANLCNGIVVPWSKTILKRMQWQCTRARVNYKQWMTCRRSHCLCLPCTMLNCPTNCRRCGVTCTRLCCASSASDKVSTSLSTLRRHKMRCSSTGTLSTKHAACSNGVRTKNCDFWTFEISMFPRQKGPLMFVVK
jgi:hypothetical protein